MFLFSSSSVFLRESWFSGVAAGMVGILFSEHLQGDLHTGDIPIFKYTRIGLFMGGG